MQQIQYETIGGGSSSAGNASYGNVSYGNASYGSVGGGDAGYSTPSYSSGPMTATPMYATSSSGPMTIGAGGMATTPAPQQKRPKAIKAHVRLQGYTSLPPAKAALMKKSINEIGEAVITINELIYDPGQPQEAIYAKISSLEGVERAANTMIALATEDAGRLPEGALKEEATRLHAELMGLSIKLSAAFQVYRDTRDPNGPIALNTLLLGVLEKGTELLGIVDRNTIACIGDLGAQAKAVILDICKHFMEEGMPTDRDPGRKRFVDSVSLYVPIMTNVCQAFMRRSNYIPSKYLKEQLIGVAETIKGLSTKYIRVVQGREVCPGIVDQLTGAIDEGCELTKAVPPFCARLDVECISSDFDYACTTLLDAVKDKTYADVNSSARSLAAEVNATIQSARDAGVSENLCEEAKRALAGVITSAKAALTSPEEMARLDFAIQQLKSSMMTIPAKSMVLHSDSVNRKLLLSLLSLLLFVLFRFSL